MTDLAATIWRPTSGNGEAGQSDDALFITEANDYLVTQDSNNLQVEAGSYTKLPATVWVESEGS